MSKYVYGIDLGTTYSCIAFQDKDGRPSVIKNIDTNSDTTPSVVQWDDEGTVVVGQQAKDTAVMYPDRTIAFVKQLIGKSDVAITIDEMYGQRSFVEAQGIDVAPVAEGRYAHFVDRAYRMNDQDWGVFSLDLLARTPEFRQAAA